MITVFALASAACSPGGSAAEEGPPFEFPLEEAGQDTSVQDDALGEALSAIPGQFAATVYDRDSDRVLAAHDAERPEETQSVVKILIALDALERGEDPDTVNEMLSRSDDDLASELWARGGGPAIVEAQARRMGLSETAAPDDPGRWGDTLMSAMDIVTAYEYVETAVPPEHAEVVLAALEDITDVAADGFDQRFGLAALDEGAKVKQGWACCLPDRALNTTGIVGPDERFTVVVLGSWPEKVPYEEARVHLDAATSAALAPLEEAERTDADPDEVSSMAP